MDEDTIARIAKRVFLAAHSDGWRGNQLRRDAQPLDAQKSWELYVSNGALAKAIEDAEADDPLKRVRVWAEWTREDRLIAQTESEPDPEPND